MYLLIFSREEYVLIFVADLHSTMYLLILKSPVTKSINKSTFTFHYVSINIRSLNSLKLLELYLHSTMYLLIC